MVRGPNEGRCGGRGGYASGHLGFSSAHSCLRNIHPSPGKKSERYSSSGHTERRTKDELHPSPTPFTPVVILVSPPHPPPLTRVVHKLCLSVVVPRRDGEEGAAEEKRGHLSYAYNGSTEWDVVDMIAFWKECLLVRVEQVGGGLEVGEEVGCDVHVVWGKHGGQHRCLSPDRCACGRCRVPSKMITLSIPTTSKS